MNKQYDENIQYYIKEAGKFPVLTREEEVALFKRLEEGDENAFEEIAQHNLRFVIKIALKYMGRGLALSDLVQEGNVGLLEVIHKFDYKKGYRFSTYAAFWIRQSIQVALRKNGSLIPIPVRKSRMLGKISEAYAVYMQEHGCEPGISEIADYLGEDEQTIQEIIKMGESVLSLDNPMDEENFTLMDRIADEETKSPLEYCMENQTRVKLAGLLKILSEKERRIMRLRYGFEHGKNLSLRKTSRLVGLSQEGVRRIEKRALDKLRRPSIKSKLAALF